MEVPTLDTSSNKGMITEASDYYLTRDKVSRETVSFQRDDYAILKCYDLNITERLRNMETKTFMGAFESKWSKKWLKNHDCGVVILPKQKKVVGSKWRYQGSRVC